MTDQGLRIGRVAGVPVFLTRSWFLFAGFVLLSYGPVLAREFGAARGYSAAAAYALMLLASVLLHEVGHCVVARAFGLPVRSITVTLLAGLTEITSPPQTPAREYAVGVAGPMVSLLLGGVGYAASEALVAGSLGWYLVRGIAVINVVLAVFNLLPGLPLDGGRVLRAVVWGTTGDADRATVVSAWAGRVLALAVVPLALLVVLPALGLAGTGLTSIVFAVLVSTFLYAGATGALRAAQLQQRMPGLVAGRLARPALGVPADLPVSEAVRRANEIGARALVVVDPTGRVTGVVPEAAVLATPEDRRPWVTAGTLSRRVDDVLHPTLAGQALLDALRTRPTPEHVVQDEQGRVGVLLTSDVLTAVTA